MKHFTKHSKYLIVALASMLIVSGVLAQVTIPTGLTNAIQYIMETIWTDDGTSSGTINVHIDPNYFFIRTGFLADGTGWNNKALGLDGSGNVVYVNANAVNTPFFNLAGNYIPKINQTGDELELSTMFQSTLGDISVGHINPLAKMHIQGNFRVDTISGSLMQYTYTTGSTQVIGAVTPPDPSQLCDCDTSPNSLDCPAVSFTTGVQQGNGQGFCVDITSSGGGLRSYWVYLESTTNINQGAFIVTGNRAGVMTLNPQATLHINGNVMIANIPAATLPAAQVLVPGPNGEVQYAPFPAGSAGEINTASNLGAGAAVFSNKVGVDLRFRTLLGQGLTSITQQTNTVTINTPAQTLARDNNTNTLSISSGNSVTLPAGGSSANAWNLTGNAGTIAGTNFIGTTDNQPVTIKVNNSEVGVLYGSTISPRSIKWGTNNSTAGGSYNVIGGGLNSNITGQYNTIGGGQGNQINTSYSTIGGGQNNTANGQYATIPGGLNNQALGNHSFAAGQNSTAAHPNSFVRSDGTVVSTTQIGQSLRYAGGGVGINTIPSYPTMNNQFLYPDITTSKNGIRIEPTPIAYMPPNPPFPGGCITAGNYSCEANTEGRIVYISDTCNNDYYVQVCTIDPLTSNHDRRRLDRQ